MFQCVIISGISLHYDMCIVIREAMLELKLDLLLVKLTCVYPIPSASLGKNIALCQK